MKWQIHKREKEEIEKRKILNCKKNIFLVYLSWLSHNKPIRGMAKAVFNHVTWKFLFFTNKTFHHI